MMIQAGQDLLAHARAFIVDCCLLTDDIPRVQDMRLLLKDSIAYPSTRRAALSRSSQCGTISSHLVSMWHPR
jgi:hypothetical protein